MPGRVQHTCIHGENIERERRIHEEREKDGHFAKEPKHQTIPLEMDFDHEMKLRHEQGSGNWQKIRIAMDYTQIQSVNPQMSNFIKNNLVPAAFGFLRGSLSVAPMTTPLKASVNY